MASFNKVILAGNLVADPELKHTTNSISVTSFRIAVGKKYIRENSEHNADFIDIVCWRQTAEFVVRNFKKGKAILLCGYLNTRTRVDKDNVKRYITEVVADEVTFVDSKHKDIKVQDTDTNKDMSDEDIPE